MDRERHQITTPFMDELIYGEYLGKIRGKIIDYYMKFSEHIRTIKNTGRLDDYYVYIVTT